MLAYGPPRRVRSATLAIADNDAAVLRSVTSDFFSVTPNDTDFSLTTVLLDPFLLGVPAGPAVTVEFQRCTGASPPSPGAFTCTVVSAGDPTPVDITGQVACLVVLP